MPKASFSMLIWKDQEVPDYINMEREMIILVQKMILTDGSPSYGRVCSNNYPKLNYRRM